MAQHIFLIYSRKDQDIAERIRQDFLQHQLTTWVLPADVPIGTPAWQRAIEQGMTQSQCVVLIISPDALSSRRIKTEVHLARTQNKRMFALLVRDDPSQEMTEATSRSNWFDARGDKYTLAIESAAYAIRDALGMNLAVSDPLHLPEPHPPAETAWFESILKGVSEESQFIRAISDEDLAGDGQQRGAVIRAAVVLAERQSQSDLPKLGGIEKLDPLREHQPLDWLKLLVWMLLRPNYYFAHEGYYPQKARRVGAWLAGLAVWLPVVLALIGISLGRALNGTSLDVLQFPMVLWSGLAIASCALTIFLDRWIAIGRVASVAMGLSATLMTLIGFAMGLVLLELGLYGFPFILSLSLAIGIGAGLGLNLLLLASVGSVIGILLGVQAFELVLIVPLSAVFIRESIRGQDQQIPAVLLFGLLSMAWLLMIWFYILTPILSGAPPIG